MPANDKPHHLFLAGGEGEVDGGGASGPARVCRRKRLGNIGPRGASSSKFSAHPQVLAADHAQGIGSELGADHDAVEAAFHVGPREGCCSGLFGIGTGKRKCHRSALRRRAGIPQVHLEGDGGNGRVLRMAGEERTPRPHADTHGGIGVELQIGDGIVSPIAYLSWYLDAVEFEVGPDVRNGRTVRAALKAAPALLGLLRIAIDPGLSSYAHAENGQIYRSAAGYVRVENCGVAQQTARFQVDTARIDAAQGHAVGDDIAAAIDHPADRIGKSFGLELAPVVSRQAGRKQCAACRGDSAHDRPCGNPHGESKDHENPVPFCLG